MTGPGYRLQVMLLDFPVVLWMSTNQWFEEVRRELSLAGLSGDPAAARLGRSTTALLARHAAALGGAGDSGRASLWAAHERGLDRIDVGHEVSTDVVATAPLLSELMADLNRSCEEGLLLSLPARPAENQLVEWIAAELVGQLGGRPPRAWPGPWARDA